MAKFIGHFHENPILDTQIYEIECEDGYIEAYHAYQIAESIMENVNEKRYTVMYLKEFVDHRGDGSALILDDSFVEIKGKQVLKQTQKDGRFVPSFLMDPQNEFL